jgi:hypothetical protein
MVPLKQALVQWSEDLVCCVEDQVKWGPSDESTMGFLVAPDVIDREDATVSEASDEAADHGK